jgi:glycosyltransferase involved in cell wall biosynthesis
MRMNKTRLRVSIVIPAHNEERHLLACLAAIEAQTVRPYEVIVVDNNSTDKTVQITQRFPFVIVVDEPQQGIVYARNAGFDTAKGDIIGRIDADIQLPPRWVEHVQRFYADNKHANQAWTGAGYFYNMRLPRLVSWGYGVLAFGLNKMLLGHYTLWGSNMAITKEQWQAVRATACSRNDIHEDLDLAMHIHQAGYGITYDASIRTNAELRRVQSNHHELWGYLLWWPRTLRIHRKKTWPIAWFFGAFCLYVVSFFLLFIDYIAKQAQK